MICSGRHGFLRVQLQVCPRQAPFLKGAVAICGGTISISYNLGGLGLDVGTFLGGPPRPSRCAGRLRGRVVGHRPRPCPARPPCQGLGPRPRLSRRSASALAWPYSP
eukprot:scaffold49573_cov348-Isochrysis_galbana.AAC.1